MMRVNPAKSIGYSPVEASAKIKAPTMILVAEKEELMSNDENGKKAFDFLQANKVPSEYHVLPGIGHYGVYKEAFDEATKLEAAWFAAHLMPPTGK
jgi:dipeptidyl aminopeptidase/acylaminoacyl peptidase